MLTSAKIDLKKYTIYSIILLSLSYFTTRSLSEFKVILLVFAASCLNHWLLILVVRKLSEAAVGNFERNRPIVSIMIVGKLVLVVAALSFGVQIMGKRIIIPVIIYVLQIVVLYLSFKKTSVEKGSY